MKWIRIFKKIFSKEYSFFWELKIFFIDSIFGFDFKPTIDIQERKLLFKDGRHNNEPSGNKYLFRALKKSCINVNDSIIDIGCGKGDALRLFCKFNFNKISGIEYSESIFQVASNNFSKFPFKNKAITLFNMDAMKFKKYDDYNYFYFYNPFDKAIMTVVLNSIKSAKKDLPFRIIYANPIEHDLVLSYFNHITFKSYPFGISGDLEIKIYSIN